MNIVSYVLAALAAGGIGYVGWQFYTRHWNLTTITADLDALVTRLEAHVDFKVKQASVLRTKAAVATAKAADASASAEKATKIAANVRALLNQ